MTTLLSREGLQLSRMLDAIEVRVSGFEGQIREAIARPDKAVQELERLSLAIRRELDMAREEMRSLVSSHALIIAEHTTLKRSLAALKGKKR